jgi:hypothetical protein
VRSRLGVVPVSKMWALKVTRSTIAATRRGSGNAVPHSEKGRAVDGEGGAFFAFGEDLEQQLSTSGVHLDVAEFLSQESVA